MYMVTGRKKLLVLDINDLLLDTYYQGEKSVTRPKRHHDEKVNFFYVYNRAKCKEFIQFCLQNFLVDVWSSTHEHNVEAFAGYMYKEAKKKLAFGWCQIDCTDTRIKHPMYKNKLVFFKELSKLWKNIDERLSWAKEDYGPSNTLLIDDSPYKASSNPMHTGIFPKPYKATNLEDNYLQEELLPYLEGLVKVEDLQAYVENHPIGKPCISPSDAQWGQLLNRPSRLKKDEQVLVPA
jgi:hypothetical protein